MPEMYKIRCLDGNKIHYLVATPQVNCVIHTRVYHAHHLVNSLILFSVTDYRLILVKKMHTSLVHPPCLLTLPWQTYSVATIFLFQAQCRQKVYEHHRKPLSFVSLLLNCGITMLIYRSSTSDLLISCIVKNDSGCSSSVDRRELGHQGLNLPDV